MNRNRYIGIEGSGGNISAAAVCGLSGRENRSARVWMVDDNENFRTLLAALLGEEGGFDCERQFSNPVEALDALAHEVPPDIILLDIQMRQYNGLDAIRPLKLAARDTHVLMLTTFAEPGSRARAFREGASDFMSKMWSTDEIAMHMRQAMEFGAVAGLLTAYLGGGDLSMEESIPEPEMVKVAEKTTVAERWMVYLRSLLKLTHHDEA